MNSISIVCSILFWDVKQDIKWGSLNCMLMAMADGKAIMKTLLNNVLYHIVPRLCIWCHLVNNDVIMANTHGCPL